MKIKEAIVNAMVKILNGICGGNSNYNKKIQKQTNINSNAVQIGEVNNGTK